MKLELLNASAVVIANEHNPTILHPFFLKNQQIVPEDWDLAEPAICTPALSLAKFQNGVVFTVEGIKLQIMDNLPKFTEDQLSPAALADRYIKKLPYVTYTAVGINFSAFAECAAPESLVMKQFLKDGVWNSQEYAVKTMGLRLVYPLAEGQLRFTCDAGGVLKPGDTIQRNGLLMNGNYHIDIPQPGSLDGASKALANYPRHLKHFLKITKDFFSLES